MEMTLYVIDGLDNGAVQQDLVKLAVETATQMDDEDLFTSISIGLLWEWVIRSADKSHFKTIVKKLTNADSSLLGPSIQYLSQYLSEDQKDEKITVLMIPTVVKHVKWLEDQIEALDKKFSWEMPDAEFPDKLSVTMRRFKKFLRGPEFSMTSKGEKTFEKFQDAQNYAGEHMREEHVYCSFEVEAKSVDDNAFVTFTKTRDYFWTIFGAAE